MSVNMRLNCDLGESFGAWQMGLDQDVMPHIDQANIACGFHGGDPLVIQNTLALAKQHQVMVGAHPSYPDLQGFGRRSMQCSANEIKAFLHYQIAAIAGMAATQGMKIHYIKPHGALYNDMMKKPSVLMAIMQAVASYHQPLVLMIQATPMFKQHQQQAKKLGLTLWAEAFADRCYDDEGYLLSREHQGALHCKEKMLAQVQQLKTQGTVTTVTGKTLVLAADSLCVHGDNMAAVAAIKEIKHLLTS